LFNNSILYWNRKKVLKEYMFNESQKNGFSFIELAIAITLLGLFTATCLQIYKIYRPNHIQSALSSIAPNGPVDAALGRYIVQNNRYPCPADPALPESNPNAGVEQRDLVTGQCAPFLATGACAGGLCRTAGTRDTDGDGLFNSVDSVLIGSIPYTTLMLNPHDTYDGWSRKFGYAVTTLLTVAPAAPDSPVADKGTITLIDGAGNAVPTDYSQVPTPPSKNIKNQYGFLVWSYGSSRRGGYTPGGQMPFACDTITPTLDATNCDMDASFMYSYENKSIVGKSNIAWPVVRSLLDGTPRFYDTYISLYEVSKCQGEWCLSSTAKNSGMPSEPSVYIGIGTKNPSAPLDVAGDIIAPKAVMESFCDTKGNNCFVPSMIGGQGIGPNSGVNGCNNQAISGIAYGKAVCPLTIGAGSVPPTTCPTGKFSSGLSQTGALICVDLP
jgi:hypothetical protein